MKPFAIAIIATGGLAAAAGALTAATGGVAGPARADTWETTPPTTPFSGSTPNPAGETADVVVSRLQGSGYRVILNRIGNASLDQCNVTGVTPGQQVVTPVTAGAKALTWQVQFTTVYVTADCSTPPTPVAAKPAS
jgi:hypothetical protein